MVPEDLWSIGELARKAGVTVKTVRFYSDRGLLPEAARSAGGHRRYGAEALDRLRTIRSLRALDLPVPDVGRLLDRQDALDGALEDAVAGRLRDLGSQLSALRWREASLRLLQDSTAEERPEVLRLVGAVATPPGTDPMVRFWRRLLPLRLPARLMSSILEAAVPQPSADPTPAHVLAFARLHVLSTDAGQCGTPHRAGDAEGRPVILYDGLNEAYALAATELKAGRPSAGGGALDCFVAAHAASLSTRDTPGFRQRLGAVLTQIADPVMDRYWQLTAEVSASAHGTPEPTLGASHDWLRTALDTQNALARRDS